MPTAALVATVGFITSACGERPDIRYETAHLRIGTDEHLCQGDLDHLELVISTAEAELSTTLDKQIDVYLRSGDEWPDTDWCGPDHYLGCFTGGNVYGDISSVDHELVHAVVGTLGDPVPFWSEGAAEALSGWTLFASSAPVDNLDLDPPELSYRTAGMFSRWLLEAYGAQSYGALLRARGDAREAFEDTYPMSFEDAQAQFFTEAPYSYAPLIGCEHPDLEASGELHWSEAIDVDCDSGDVRGGSRGIAVHRVVTIPERGHYEFSTSAPKGAIARCPDEHLALLPAVDDPTLGDVPLVNDFFVTGYMRAFEGEGELTVFDLAPGRYELTLAFPDHESRTTQLDLRAAVGPIPQTPESPG